MTTELVKVEQGALDSQFEKAIQAVSALKKQIAELGKKGNIEELSKIKNTVEAYKIVAAKNKQDALSRECFLAELQCAKEIGKVLLKTTRHPGSKGMGRDSSKNRRSEASTAYPFKLEEMGLTKDESSNYQRIAKLPSDILDEALETEDKHTISRVVRLARKFYTFRRVLDKEGLEYDTRKNKLRKAVLESWSEKRFKDEVGIKEKKKKVKVEDTEEGDEVDGEEGYDLLEIEDFKTASQEIYDYAKALKEFLDKNDTVDLSEYKDDLKYILQKVKSTFTKVADIYKNNF